MKFFKLFICSIILTMTGSVLLASDNFITNQQADLKILQENWDQKNIPEGMQVETLRAISSRDSGTSSVSLYAKNTNFDVVEGIGFQIEELAATLEPKKVGEPISFDDVESFTINIHHGEVTVTPEALTELFNKQILDYWPRPLDELTITTDDDYVNIEADLRLWSWFPGIWLPAELGGKITLSEQNQMVYDIDKVNVLGIPLLGLLKTLHIPLTWLLSVDREGAELGPYEFVLDHRSVFPPPTLAGDLTKVSVTSAGLHLSFADNTAAQFNNAPVGKDSYLWIQSGDPRLFGIVVTNSRVAIISDSDTIPLRFNLYNYRKQVAGGTLQMPLDGTLIVTLPADTGGDS